MTTCGTCKRRIAVVTVEGNWVGFTYYCSPCFAAYWSDDDAELTRLRLEAR